MEKITGTIERGWNLYSGGVVNLRTLTAYEEESVLGLIQRLNDTPAP